MTKQSITKILLTILISMMGTNAFAHDIEVKNAEGVTIYYQITGATELMVTYQGRYKDPNPNDYSGNIIIPESVIYEGKTYQVTSIGESAFSGCSSLSSVIIPNGVTYIGLGAFSRCSGLTTVSIPNSVTTIEVSTFSECSSLTSVTIPNSVTSINGSTFADCSALTSVTIPNSVTSIGGSAFRGCSGLTSVTIPNSVKNIREMAFDGCTGLTTVTIGNGVIGNSSFSGCSSLTSLIIGNGVTSIGIAAFSECSNLTSVTIPNSVTYIGGDAFSFCSGLNTIRVESGNPNYDSRNDCNAIIEKSSNTLIAGCKNTIIPNSVTSIGGSAFRGCSGLTSVTIPNSVTSIGGGAFSSCSGLTSVIIPSSVTSIDNYAFGYCTSIQTVKTYITEPYSISKNVFANEVYRQSTLYIPAGTESLYTRFDGWKEFLKIVEMDASDTPDVPGAEKCKAPTISYKNGKLVFECDTEGVTFVTDITDTDIKKYYDATISLNATYKISFYATKDGYNNSDVVTATLCWIDVEPKTEGITNSVANVRANPVLIQSNGNVLSVLGAPEGAEINVYSLSGQKVGSARAISESTEVITTLKAGEIGIVKIGEKTVKVAIK